MLNALERLEKLEEEKRQLLEQGIEQFLIPFIGGDPMYVYIQGWTPDFNDGEPCTHCVDWCCGEEILEYTHYENNEEIFKGITKEDFEKSRNINSKHKDILLFQRAMNAVVSYLDYKYETDYQCLLICKNNKLTTIKLDYYCGY